MFQRRRVRIGMAITMLCGGLASTLPAQQRVRSDKTDAPLVVDGTVRQVFRNVQQGQNDYLVELQVSRADARESAAGWARARVPAPGETIFVHTGPLLEPAGRPASNDSRKDLPTAGAKVRAYLTFKDLGSWGAAGPDWFEGGADRPAGINPADLVRDAVESARQGASLGMTTDVMRVDGLLALRVSSVARGGTAQESGLEVGDVIAAINDAEIDSPDQLTSLAAKGKKFSLIVMDVHTKRASRVEIDPQAKPDTPGTTATPSAQPTRVSLGLSAEPVTLGTRSALKVTRVDPAGPAAKANLEPGDIIVAANGVPTTGVEQLMSALRKSGPTLKLTVRDSRSGRDVDVDVSLGGTTAVVPVDTPASMKPVAGKLGAVTELAFNDSDFAVKVTEVEPGSIAARAGLRPGILIVSADGKPVLHPNDLNEAVHNSKGTLRLTVVDPSSGKKSNLDVSLR